MIEDGNLLMGKMKKELKFSLIVPVYNVEKYLRQCIESCEKQDIRKDDYEIVAVNDGSTDNSLSILTNLAREYGNITVVSQANAGLSAARNAGLKVARGKYIWFIDSDDWIETDVLQDFYEECERENLDCLALYYQLVDEKGKCPCPVLTERKVASIVVNGALFLSHYLTDSFCAPTFIFKRSSWLRYDFQFRKNIIYEDLDLIPMVVARMQRVKSCPYVVYNYRQRTSSLVHKVTYKMIDDLYAIIQRYEIRLQTDENKGIIMPLHRIISSAIIGYCILLSKLPNSEEKRKRVITMISEYPKLEQFGELPWLKRSFIHIYNFSPFLLFQMLNMKNKLWK